MTDQQYNEMILKIVEDGRGFKALQDILKNMEIIHETTLMAFKEFKFERENIKKAYDTCKTNKDKLRLLEKYMGINN